MRPPTGSARLAALGLVSALALAGTAACSAIPGGYYHRNDAAKTSTGATPSSSTGPTKTAAPDRYDADSGSFTLCAQGSYPSYAVFTGPEKGRTATVKPGNCTTKTFGKENAGHHAVIYGLDASAPFLIGDDQFGGDDDEQVKTTGTVMTPDWFAF